MELNLAAICDALTEAIPDREAVVFRDRRLTWATFGERCRRLAGLLADAGLGVHGEFAATRNHESRHDHVALYLYNGNEYLEGMLGSYTARCAPVNVNYRYTASELRYVLADSRSRVVIYHAAFAPTLAEVLADLPDVEVLLQVADDSGNELLPGALDYEAALANGSPQRDPRWADQWSGDDLYICYTGGTTGMPKGALWRQADFLVAALGIQRRDGSDHQSIDELVDAARRSSLRALPAAPLMHGAAHWNAMSCWVSGGTLVLSARPERLDPADIWSTVQAERATSLLIVGDAMARPLIDELDRATHAGTPYDTASLRQVLTGGAILAPTRKAALFDRLPGVRIIDLLGSSESGRQGVSNLGPGDDPTAGFAPSSTAVVLDETLRAPLEPGSDEIGWLAQSGRVPLGYLGDADKSARTFPTIDGVRHAVAGDRARLAADGSIELLGRDSVTINTGGEKVFAEEVEIALTSHPAVFDAVVCGRPSERWGQEVVAVIALASGEHATAEELRAHCASSLAGFKLPKEIVVVDRVERSPSGKADYRWAVETVHNGRP